MGVNSFPNTDLAAMITALQGQITTLQSTVNGIPSPIQPTKPYRIGMQQTYTPGQWYYNVLSANGKGVITGVYAFIYAVSMNTMSLQLVVDGTTYTFGNVGGASLATGGGQGSEDHGSSISFLAPVYFNSTFSVNFMCSVQGYSTSSPFMINVDYSLV